jgi:hypothetical protein
MKAKRTEHFKNPRGLQKFSTADIPNLKCNLVGKNIAKLRHQRGWAREEMVAKLQLLGCNVTLRIRNCSGLSQV